jgi:hypothetical protein
MSGLAYLFSILAIMFVLYWYADNAKKGDHEPGKKGLLAWKDGPVEIKKERKKFTPKGFDAR